MCDCVIEFVDRTQTDCVGEKSDTAASRDITTDARPTTLPQDSPLSFKDFIIGYPTQTGMCTWHSRFCSLLSNTDRYLYMALAVLFVVIQHRPLCVHGTRGSVRCYPTQTACVHGTRGSVHCYRFRSLLSNTDRYVYVTLAVPFLVIQHRPLCVRGTRGSVRRYPTQTGMCTWHSSVCSLFQLTAEMCNSNCNIYHLLISSAVQSRSCF